MTVAEMDRTYYTRVAAIAQDVADAMRYRMAQRGDSRPLFVYVSPTDGGHVIGHEGQHAGYWRTATPITGATPYEAVPRILADELRRAPLYAGGVR
jgi:predicted RNA-binding protein YlqC (UPF0109 family)